MISLLVTEVHTRCTLAVDTSLMWKVPEAAYKESHGIQGVLLEFRTLCFLFECFYVFEQHKGV